MLKIKEEKIIKSKEKNEDDKFFNLLCDLEDALENEYGEGEASLLKAEFAELLDKWEFFL